MRSRISGALILAGIAMFLPAEGFFLTRLCAAANTWTQSHGPIPYINPAGEALLAALSMPPEGRNDKAPEERKDTSYILGKVKEWRDASVNHVPGEADPAAAAIGSWTSGDLEIVMDFITDLASRSKKSRNKTVAKTPIRNRLRLTNQEVKEGDLNRILKQGALLHTDIALLNLETGRDFVAGGLIGVFIDGRVVIRPRNLHWELARRLINSINPSPAKDPMVRQWYVATTASMQSRRHLAYAGENIESALKIFPYDYKLLFYAGVMHETWASPSNQNIQLPPTRTVNYGSKEKELNRARELFQKVIDANPNFAEAHLRLGRVLGLLGRHDQAIVELRKADAFPEDPQLSYYTSLYLGYEFEMASQTGEALEQYTRAASLYPSAQSPLLALSQLAHSSHDTDGAMRHIQSVFTLPRKDPWEADPFWIYDISPVRDSTALIEEMYTMFGGLPR